MFYAAGLRTEPAHLVRGSSRRIMTMRYQPANIRVINRRASSTLSSALLFQSKDRAGGSRLTIRIAFLAGRPSRVFGLPERCSPARVR